MSPSDDDRIGTRIAMFRKRAGLTQHGLAQLIPYTYSTLRHVESGYRAAAPQLVDAVAHALHIDVTALTGPPVLLPDRVAALVRPVREALDLFDLPAGRVTPRPEAELLSAADEVCRLVRGAHLQHAATALPLLLAELTAACQQQGSDGLWRALASAYRSTHDVAVKLGCYDLATLALDRMGWAAETASDPVLGAIRQYKRALAYRSPQADHSIGLRMVAEGHRMIEQTPANVEAQAVAGQLHLGAAVIAARAADESRTDEHLEAARELAAQTGEVGWVHWLSFGPANVDNHEMFTRLQLRHFDEAYTVARTVKLPRGWAASRRAAHFVDRARAEMETGRTEAALKSLVKAREVAPQQTRHHPRVRETVRGLLHLRRQSPDTLSRMASWVGV